MKNSIFAIFILSLFSTGAFGSLPCGKVKLEVEQDKHFEAVKKIIEEEKGFKVIDQKKNEKYDYKIFVLYTVPGSSYYLERNYKAVLISDQGIEQEEDFSTFNGVIPRTRRNLKKVARLLNECRN